MNTASIVGAAAVAVLITAGVLVARRMFDACRRRDYGHPGAPPSFLRVRHPQLADPIEQLFFDA